MPEEKTILLVEDEAVLALSEAMMLRGEGYTVVLAGSGEEALGIIRAGATRIDLVLMDINLGHGVDGTQAAVKILETRDIPILFLSSHVEPEIVKKTEEITSYGYVVKNTGITVLAASIKMAFRLHAAYQDLRHTNEKLNLALEANQAGTWEWDLENNQFDWSPEFRRVIGLREDAPASMDTWMQVVHPDDQQSALRRIREAIERKANLLNDFRIVFSEGEVRWIRVTGKPTYRDEKMTRMCGLCMDITDLQRAEEKVRASRARYETLFEKAGDGICIIDLNGKILEVNESFAGMHGYSTEEILQMGLAGLSLEGKNVREDRLRRVIAGETLTIEVEHRHSDGHTLPLEVTNQLILSNDEMLVIATHRDISERKRVEKALKKSNEHLLNLADNLPGSVAFIDVRTMTYEFVNTAYEAEYGLNRSQIAGSLVREVIGEANYRDALPYLQQTINGVSASFVKFSGLSSGKRWNKVSFIPLVGEDGVVETIVEVSFDISDLKHAEEAMRESETIHRKAIEVADAVPYRQVFHDVNGERKPVFDFLSEGIRQLTGYGSDEFTSEVFDSILVETHLLEDLAPYVMEDAIGLVRSGTIPYWKSEYLIRARNGELRWLFDAAVDLVDSNGVIQSSVGVFQDITARKRIEEGLQKALAEKEVLMQELQHRVKNSLSIAASLLGLEERNLQNEHDRAIFASARSRLQSMAAVYEQLYQNSGMERINLGLYVQSLSDALTESYLRQPGQVEIRARVDSVQLDLKRTLTVGLILNELITNALKYAFPASEVEVKEASDPVILVDIAQNGNELVLSVTDNGIGMSDQTIKKTGMGLNLVKLLTTQLEGRFLLDGSHGCKAQVLFRMEA